MRNRLGLATLALATAVAILPIGNADTKSGIDYQEGLRNHVEERGMSMTEYKLACESIPVFRLFDNWCKYAITDRR